MSKLHDRQIARDGRPLCPECTRSLLEHCAARGCDCWKCAHCALMLAPGRSPVPNPGTRI